MFDKQVDNARANLSMGHIRNFILPSPPIEIQQKIVAQLDRAFAQIATLHAEQTTRLHHLETLKSSILSEAFQGKL